MNSNESDPLVEKLRDHFAQSVDALDGQTLSRITRIRYSALEQANHKSRKSGFWLPAGAVASVCLAVLIFTLVPQQTVEEKIFIDEIEIISELDFYENLEFYEWLDHFELPT
jgi:hypothetical protein